MPPSSDNSPIKACIFDWAGTMIDFGCCAPVVALHGAFAEIGLSLSDAEARADMGMAKRAHIHAILSRAPQRSAFEAMAGRAPADADIDDLFRRVEPRMVAAAGQHTRLIDGATELVRYLRTKGVRIGSGTGYSRSMMGQILAAAADQGYAPDLVVCAGETLEGRPSPLMTWKALVELGVWPARTAIKVDDAVVGIHEGCEAGTWTLGVAASGNGVGLPLDAFLSLTPEQRQARTMPAAQALAEAGADYVVGSVADILGLLPEIEDRIRAGERPGTAPCRISI
ncbi:phosphonoacetaldehyde hydrolase [Asticcacaulis biprosthecium C19]|uniref:Phosphonoacetaldehyde hydrolase n=1 Tax=Asticcacaulis biprosthecium C19 TaxID=715226 RepID=F4QSS2_9CAUL|nr:phosphonoacetaldehyde hydrolase [Asticcacaulis biprosthecium]EGF89792.1 phosphonoacetaldehyde hydrolase [Asticcacaulis biprosthecium C19]